MDEGELANQEGSMSPPLWPTPPGNFKYLLPLDDEIAERIRTLAEPYPNAPQRERCTWIPSRRGGVNPTVALQSRQLKFKRLANSDHLASPPQLLSGCIRCLQ
jgi:hypothetical protein